MSRRLNVSVDHSRCVGNAMCLATAPGVFAHNADRQSEVVDPAGDTEEKILEAAFNCPTGAIRVEVDETGKRLFPRAG
ncbi:MAG: ferredoxin [Gemmatimonadota bacterium]